MRDHKEPLDCPLTGDGKSPGFAAVDPNLLNKEFLLEIREQFFLPGKGAVKGDYGAGNWKESWLFMVFLSIPDAFSLSS